MTTPAPPPAPRPQPPEGFAQRWRLALLNAGPPAVLLMFIAVAALLWASYEVLDPTPPKHLVLATGPEDGAYAAFAKRYLPVLRAHGLQVELRATRGSAENLALLRDPASGVQVAFVQGGVEGAAQEGSAGSSAGDATRPMPAAVRLASLGEVALEPLWLFYRQDAAARLSKGVPENLSQLAGWRIDTGPAGAGSGPLFQQLARAHGLPATSFVPPRDIAVSGVVGLVEGTTDALAMVSAADAPLLQYLLQTPGVALFDFAQSEAYARRFSFLRPVVLPRGVIDLAGDRPPRDIRLVAATASLLAHADLHPALQQLLLQAAQEAHREPGWFHRSGEFPNAQVGDGRWPLADEAARFHRSGPPWLQRWLPFWLANFIDRMWIVLLPLIAVLIPLSRVVPPLIDLRFRSRVFRWYGHLRAVEHALDGPTPDLAALRATLERIDAQTEQVKLPLSYTNELYDLRSHIQLVRKRIILRAQGEAEVPR